MQGNAAIHREFRRAKASKATELIKRWDAANPERRAEISSAAAKARSRVIRASREGVAPEDLAAADRMCADWLASPDWRCAYCDKPADRKNRTVDHVVPMTARGKHAPGNLRPACRSCNSRKGPAKLWFA